MTNKTGLAALAGLCTLALSSCGFNTGRGFQVGVKQMEVNLSFANGSLLTTRVVQLPPVPAPSFGAFLATVGNQTGATPVLSGTPTGSQNGSGETVPAALPATAPQCPAPGVGAKPDVPLGVYVTKAPATGLYTEHNSGKFTLIADGIPLSGAYPAQGEFDIQNERETSTTSSVAGTVTDFYYDLVEVGVDGSQTVTTYLAQLDNGGVTNEAQLEAGTGPGTTGQLDLVKQVTTDSQGTSSFSPSSPVEIMEMGTGVGASWTSVGIDTASGTVMQVSGQVAAIDNVKLCGQVVEAYRVVSNERISNPHSGFTSTTSSSDPNVYEVAPQFGGLFMSEHIDTTTTVPAKSGAGGAGATVVDLDYTSTLDSTRPQ